MTEQNYQLKNILGLCGSICASVLMSLPAMAQKSPDLSHIKKLLSDNTPAILIPVPQIPSANDRPLPIVPGILPQIPSTSDRQLPILPSKVPQVPTDFDLEFPDLRSLTPQVPSDNDRPLPSVPRTIPPVPSASDRPLLRLPPTIPSIPSASDRPLLRLPPTIPPVPSASDRLLRPLPQTFEIDSASPPPPELLEAPSATITPINGVVNITLINATAATINYEVLGQTDQRTLQGRSEITLRNLKAPVNITFERLDSGLIKLTPQASSESGALKVTLTETTNLDIDKKAMTIQETGNVFLN